MPSPKEPIVPFLPISPQDQIYADLTPAPQPSDLPSGPGVWEREGSLWCVREDKFGLLARRHDDSDWHWVGQIRVPRGNWHQLTAPSEAGELRERLAKYQRWEQNRNESEASLNAQAPCGHPAQLKMGWEDGKVHCWECEYMALDSQLTAMREALEAFAALFDGAMKNVDPRATLTSISVKAQLFKDAKTALAQSPPTLGERT